MSKKITEVGYMTEDEVGINIDEMIQTFQSMLGMYKLPSNQKNALIVAIEFFKAIEQDAHTPPDETQTH